MATVVTPDTAPAAARRRPWPIEFYRSAVGKKWVMAVTGLIGMAFIVAHLIGNLKLYLSREELDLYGEALRDFPKHLLPRTVFLWTPAHRPVRGARPPRPLRVRARRG